MSNSLTPSYGVFRFIHEFARDTPRILGPITGYQIAALGVALLGAMGFFLRQRQTNRPGQSLPIALNQKEELI